MIAITRERDGWRCVVSLKDTPAKYYAIYGSGVDSPHVAGTGVGPHEALDDALRALGLLTIRNPSEAGREPR